MEGEETLANQTEKITRLIAYLSSAGEKPMKQHFKSLRAFTWTIKLQKKVANSSGAFERLNLPQTFVEDLVTGSPCDR